MSRPCRCRAPLWGGWLLLGMRITLPQTTVHRLSSSHPSSSTADSLRPEDGQPGRRRFLLTDHHRISKEHAMSPLIMIDLVRAIDADRQREGRRILRRFRRSA